MYGIAWEILVVNGLLTIFGGLLAQW